MKKITSPRANSSFQTTETRETFRMSLEILDILGRGHNGNHFSTATIVNIGHKFGYCRPLKDKERIACSHPYSKILSMMTDPKSPIFVNNLEKITDNNGFSFRLRHDCYRKPSGNWRKRVGVPLKYKLPENN